MKNFLSIKNIIISTLLISFGNHWYVFIGFIILNILDWITGSLKAIKLKELSSEIGIIGLIKKLGYWIIISIAFYLSYILTKLGTDILGINLSFMYLLGWFTITSLIINEVISILENLIILNIKVPFILIKGLKVTKKLLNETEKDIFKK